MDSPGATVSHVVTKSSGAAAYATPPSGAAGTAEDTTAIVAIAARIESMDRARGVLDTRAPPHPAR